MSLTECAQEFWTKALRFVIVYSKYLLKEIFIEGLHVPILQIIIGYCGKNCETDL